MDLGSPLPPRVPWTTPRTRALPLLPRSTRPPPIAPGDRARVRFPTNDAAPGCTTALELQPYQCHSLSHIPAFSCRVQSGVMVFACCLASKYHSTSCLRRISARYLNIAQPALAFPGVQKQDVLAAAARDGLMAATLAT